jgi:hypothetical protein
MQSLSCIVSKEVFMFVETYFDERAPGSTNTSEPVVPYPQLSGEALTVWQKYLPTRRSIEVLQWWLDTGAVPGSVITEIERAKNTTGLFDRVEIWRRADDPMAVGIIDGKEPRYFSIVRWGDAEITLEQAKKRLRADKWLTWLSAAGAVSILLLYMLTAIVQFVLVR